VEIWGSKVGVTLRVMRHESHDWKFSSAIVLETLDKELHAIDKLKNF